MSVSDYLTDEAAVSRLRRFAEDNLTTTAGLLRVSAKLGDARPASLVYLANVYSRRGSTDDEREAALRRAAGCRPRRTT